MFTLLPELNVACMVTVSIKIKQKKMYAYAIISVEYALLRCTYGQRGECACVFWSGGTEQCFVPSHPTPSHLPCSSSSMAFAITTSGFFSKVISTSVFTGLGGSMCGRLVCLSVRLSMCEAVPAALR